MYLTAQSPLVLGLFVFGLRLLRPAAVRLLLDLLVQAAGYFASDGAVEELVPRTVGFRRCSRVADGGTEPLLDILAGAAGLALSARHWRRAGRSAGRKALRRTIDAGL